ncbi:MAG: DUF1934 domain-containing protein [Clostridia bacterium]|nr:DUF1934 domain-containing protein [Clostridia bacterium]
MKRICITSIIDELDECGMVESSDKSENTADLTVTEVGGILTLSFTELSDGGKTDSLITVKGDEITVSRKGAVVSEFVFREGFCHKSLYKVVPYSFDAEIFTRKIRNNLTRGVGTLSILYDMTVGGGKKRVNMKISVSEVEK